MNKKDQETILKLPEPTLPMIFQPAQILIKSDTICKACLSPKTGSRHADLSGGIFDFTSKLFNTSDWPARWHCGNWSQFHGWLYIISDLLIWASYFAIPFLLFRLLTKRKDVPFPKI
ncbi:MAG TPA: hypothetical protein VF610_01890, partial [Segetibacter sp.]